MRKGRSKIPASLRQPLAEEKKEEAPKRIAAVVTVYHHNSHADGLESLVGQSMDDLERRFIAETLKFTGGNREEAAKMLGIGERTLYRKIDKYDL
jgi:DNA-binding NtrC family response regulator